MTQQHKTLQPNVNNDILNIAERIRSELIFGPVVVYGEPVTQGDHTVGFRRRGKRQVYIRHANGLRLDDWRKIIGWTFRSIQQTVNRTVPLDGAVGVELDFFYPHLNKHYTSKGRPSKNYECLKTSPPDGDKLMRAVFDALTRIAYEDDKNIVLGRFTKTYQNVPKPGVVIRVYRTIYQESIGEPVSAELV